MISVTLMQVLALNSILIGQYQHQKHAVQAEDKIADLVVFDESTIQDQATYTDARPSGKYFREKQI